MSKAPVLIDPLAVTSKNPFFAIVTAIPLGDEDFATNKGELIEDAWSAVLNVGGKDGVELRQKFVIFSLGPELFDPKTSESLGHFEIVRGEAEVSHLQERMCTVRSTNYRMEQRQMNALLVGLGKADSPEWVRIPRPFEVIRVGDLARRI